MFEELTGICVQKVNSYLVWGGPSLFYADKIAKLHQERSNIDIGIIIIIINIILNFRSSTLEN